jgi:hypothetical protein
MTLPKITLDASLLYGALLAALACPSCAGSSEKNAATPDQRASSAEVDATQPLVREQAPPTERGTHEETPPNSRAAAEEQRLSPVEGRPAPRSDQAAYVQEVVSSHTAELQQQCWQPALDGRQPDAPTSVRVMTVVTMSADGQVVSVSIAEEPAFYPELDDCIIRNVRTWRFPQISATTTLNVPFVFGTREGIKQR